MGIEVALFGALFLSAGVAVGGWFSGKGALLARPGVLAMVIVASLVFNSGALTGETSTTNPFPPNSQSLAIGQALYRQHCLACHSVGGHGDGPAAASLNPPPLDLTVHAPLHTDAELFYFIDKGIPRTAMKAFGDDLSDDEIWHLVNYIKSLPQ